jgi:hypothetical protein
MPDDISDIQKGYWWECDKDKLHRVRNFDEVGKHSLVTFFFKLSKSGWDQKMLSAPCKMCSGTMRITYDFPRSDEKVRLSLIHVVGLTNSIPKYLPMLWETKPHYKDNHWFDFKYVGCGNGKGRGHGYQARGLSRPAVFTRRELKTLFEEYEKIIGRKVFE